MKNLCPVCGGGETIELINIPVFPVNQNLVYDTFKEAKSAKTGELNIISCHRCGFTWNSKFDENLVVYDNNYDNSQAHSQVFSKYVNNQLQTEFSQYKKGAASFLEIGCGKGYYIKQLAEYLQNPGNSYFGFDTSYAGSLSFPELKLDYYKEYFKPEYSYLNPDFLISRHVIEHICDPVEFLRSIRQSVKKGLLFLIETPCLDWILSNNVIFDFTYEHCNYFNHETLSLALLEANFNIVKNYNDFGGQYMVFIAQAADASTPSAENSKIKNQNDTFFCFRKEIKQKFNSIRAELDSKNAAGEKVFLWGAAGKGSSFVNMFDSDAALIEGLIDVNTNKQNKFVGATGHQIFSPDDALARIEEAGGSIYIMNPVYQEEIKALIRSKTERKIKLALL